MTDKDRYEIGKYSAEGEPRQWYAIKEAPGECGYIGDINLFPTKKKAIEFAKNLGALVRLAK